MVFSEFIQNCLSIDIINNDIYKVRRGDLSLLHADDFENIAYYGKEIHIKYQINNEKYSEKFSYSNEDGYFIVNDIINYVLNFYNQYFTDNPEHKRPMKNLYFEGFLHKDGVYYVYLFKKIERSAEFNENILKILKDCLGQLENNVIKEVEEYVDLSSKSEELKSKEVNLQDNDIIETVMTGNPEINSETVKII